MGSHMTFLFLPKQVFYIIGIVALGIVAILNTVTRIDIKVGGHWYVI